MTDYLFSRQEIVTILESIRMMLLEERPPEKETEPLTGEFFD